MADEIKDEQTTTSTDEGQAQGTTATQEQGSQGMGAPLDEDFTPEQLEELKGQTRQAAAEYKAEQRGESQQKEEPDIEEQLNDMSWNELRRHATTLGVDGSGNRTDIESRILALGKDGETGKDDDATGQADGDDDDSGSTGDKLPDELRQRALDAGLAEEDLALFKTKPQLERALTALDRALIKGSATADDDDGGEPDVEGQSLESDDTSGTTESGDDDGGDDKEPPKTIGDLELDDDTLSLHPELAEPIQEWSNKVKAYVGHLSQEVERLSGQLNLQYEREFAREMDGFFGDLIDTSSTWAELFGEGTMDDVIARHGEQSEQVSNRQDLVAHAESLADALQARGKTPPPMSELRRRALYALHPDRITDNVRRQLRGNLKKTRGQAVRRPTPRDRSDLTPVERAEQKVDKVLSERGVAG